MKRRVFETNEVVFREGDHGTCFYRIESGIAGVYLHYDDADQRKLTEMKPGQYFGEMAIIESWPRSSTVVAEEELHVLEIGEEELNSYFAVEPDKILAIMKQLSGRIRTLTEEYDEVTAFLNEKKEADAPKKQGFLDRLKKYIDISKSAKKAPVQALQDEDDRVDRFVWKDDSPLQIRSFPEGTVLFREGDPGDCMYAVHGGEVDIYTNYGNALEKKLTTLYANSFFGEMGMIDQEVRSATAVIAMDETIIERIGPEDLERLFEKNPMEVDQIMRHLSKRLRRLTVDYAAACEEAAKTE